MVKQLKEAFHVFGFKNFATWSRDLPYQIVYINLNPILSYDWKHRDPVRSHSSRFRSFAQRVVRLKGRFSRD